MSKWKAGIALAALGIGLVLNNEQEIKESYQKVKTWVKEKVRKDKKEPAVDNEERKREDKKNEIPERFLCRISGKLMEDPVISPYGHCFEKQEIEKYLKMQELCPITGKPLALADLTPSFTTRAAINKFKGEINALI